MPESPVITQSLDIPICPAFPGDNSVLDKASSYVATYIYIIYRRHPDAGANGGSSCHVSLNCPTS